ncbi:hypothetical protein ACH4GE_34295 [Streptomyces tendae]|uniref:hypothetical protein n=1 Tax=Streptomyces tendae TaxID=1932 RepID=UPI0037A3143F
MDVLFQAAGGANTSATVHLTSQGIDSAKKDHRRKRHISLALGNGLDLLGTLLGQWLLVLFLAAGITSTWLSRRIRTTAPELLRVRRFTLLRAESADGTPVRYETTRPTGTRVTPWVDGRQRLYELTDVQLEDGSYAAESLDHR